MRSGLALAALLLTVPALILHALEAADLASAILRAWLGTPPAIVVRAPPAPGGSEVLVRLALGARAPALPMLGAGLLLLPRGGLGRLGLAAALVPLFLALAAAPVAFRLGAQPLLERPPLHAPELAAAFRLHVDLTVALLAGVAAAVGAGALAVAGLPKSLGRLGAGVAALAFVVSAALAVTRTVQLLRITRLAWGVYLTGDPAQIAAHAVSASLVLACLGLAAAFAGATTVRPAGTPSAERRADDGG